MECIKPRYIHKHDIVVPCGNCVFCTATKRADWSLRLQYEAKLHDEKRFVTLTYADAHLNWLDGVPQLSKRDLQLFFKRLRKGGAKFRYYAVGEYGSKTYRPHYHVILFGKTTDVAIRQAWQLGLVHIGTVTEASIQYTLGYIVNGKGWQMRTKRVAPFALMSRGRWVDASGRVHYGLGSNYLSPQMIAWHKSGRKNYAMIYGQKRHLPRYYKTKIFSKIDLVRIAVRDQKAVFKKMVAWVRSKPMSRLADPLAYRDEQMKILAQRIRGKMKENLTI